MAINWAKFVFGSAALEAAQAAEAARRKEEELRALAAIAATIQARNEQFQAMAQQQAAAPLYPQQSGWRFGVTYNFVSPVSPGKVISTEPAVEIAPIKPNLNPDLLNPMNSADTMGKLIKLDGEVSVTHLVPDSVTMIVGWRAWKIGTNGLSALLRSTGVDYIWEPQVRQEARCLSGEPVQKHLGPSPDWNCHCGFWAFKSPQEMMQVMAEHSYRGFGALGTVYLWGRVIETEHGWRGQYAYPKDLYLCDVGAEEIGWTYQTPVRAATEEMKEHG